jgi:hypothetical protein
MKLLDLLTEEIFEKRYEFTISNEYLIDFEFWYYDHADEQAHERHLKQGEEGYNDKSDVDKTPILDEEIIKLLISSKDCIFNSYKINGIKRNIPFYFTSKHSNIKMGAILKSNNKLKYKLFIKTIRRNSLRYGKKEFILICEDDKKRYITRKLISFQILDILITYKFLIHHSIIDLNKIGNNYIERLKTRFKSKSEEYFELFLTYSLKDNDEFQIKIDDSNFKFRINIDNPFSFRITLIDVI